MMNTYSYYDKCDIDVFLTIVHLHATICIYYKGTISNGTDKSKLVLLIWQLLPLGHGCSYDRLDGT